MITKEIVECVLHDNLKIIGVILIEQCVVQVYENSLDTFNIGHCQSKFKMDQFTMQQRTKCHVPQVNFGTFTC